MCILQITCVVATPAWLGFTGGAGFVCNAFFLIDFGKICDTGGSDVVSFLGGVLIGALIGSAVTICSCNKAVKQG